jgi:hypothetical protein
MVCCGQKVGGRVKISALVPPAMAPLKWVMPELGSKKAPAFRVPNGALVHPFWSVSAVVRADCVIDIASSGAGASHPARHAKAAARPPTVRPDKRAEGKRGSFTRFLLSRARTEFFATEPFPLRPGQAHAALAPQESELQQMSRRVTT